MGSMRPTTRRALLLTAGPGLLLAGPARPARGESAETEEPEVTPGEDLMREHGVLKRVLLVYREILHRLETKAEIPPDPLNRSAALIRSFVEDYHEKLEEDHLFPRFRKANRLVDLVEVLQAQHRAGRRLIDRILQLATASALKDEGDRQQLRTALTQFVRMYEPHEAREDTVLFPAFAEIVSRSEYDALGEAFEEQEHKLFGEEGFHRMVDRVASIEKELGVYDLAQFTPREDAGSRGDRPSEERPAEERPAEERPAEERR